MKVITALLLAAAIALAPVPSFAQERGNAAAPERIPFKTEKVVEAGDIWRIIAAMIGAIVIAVGAIYVVKTYTNGGFDKGRQPQRRIKLLETRRLTPKTALFLVEVDGRTLLLGQQGDQLTCLDAKVQPTAQEKGGE